MSLLCLCVILSSGTFHLSLPPGVNEELSEPLRERREVGGKEKDEARRDGKAENLLSHMVILLYQLSFSSLFNTFPSVMFLFSKCTLYWFDLMFGLISFSPLPFPALVSRLDKRPIDCIRCSEPDIPIKAFKAEFLVCQSLHFILCSYVFVGPCFTGFSHIFKTNRKPHCRQATRHVLTKHAVYTLHSQESHLT